MATNFYEAEINKFATLATDWWNPDGKMQLLHQLNPCRMELIQSIILTKGKKILDFGCGGGILCESLAETGAKVTGIDMAKETIMAAKLHAKETNLKIEYIAESLEQHLEKQCTYDIITCMEILEHVPDYKKIVQQLSTALNPNGYLFISTINRNIKSYLLAKIAAEYILQLLPKGTHNFKKFITPTEIISIAIKYELNLEKIIGLTYNPLTKIFSLSNNVDINYFLVFKKI